MTEFYSETLVKKTRKEHRCDGCSTPIPIGSQALRYSGKFDGDFGNFIHHPECREAECALNKLHATYYQEWIPLSDMESDDHQWLLDEHPVVAARFGVTAATIAENAAERERIRIGWLEAAQRREAAAKALRQVQS